MIVTKLDLPSLNYTNIYSCVVVDNKICFHVTSIGAPGSENGGIKDEVIQQSLPDEQPLIIQGDSLPLSFHVVK